MADRANRESDQATQGDRSSWARAVAIPILVLAVGHMLSNLLRTLPALGLDVMARDLNTSPETLASLTSAYHLAFAAGQIVVGVALDRWSVKRVALCLLVATMIGSATTARAQGPASFLIAQAVLGFGTSGMLLCPLALAAQLVAPARFSLWTGLTLGVGNTGMLLSATPLAWLIANLGWRVALWLACLWGLAILASVLLLVPDRPPPVRSITPLAHEVAKLMRLALSPALRGIMAMAFVSLAVVLALRGVWAGPWLMGVKGASRIDAGHVLLLFTMALMVGPLIAGILDRWIPYRRAVIASGQLLAGVALILIASGGPGGPLSQALHVPQLARKLDAVLMVALGVCISMQPLLYAMTQDKVAPGEFGKAMSAVNLSFFLGTAVLQAATGPVAHWSGVAGVLLFMGLALLAATAAFLIMTRPPPRPRGACGCG